MKKRHLTNDILVSPLGLGTVKFGRNQGVKYPTHFELPSDQQIDALLGLASDLGINLLDTAPAYGLSEERLGKHLRNRHEWILETKVGEAFENGESSFDFSAEAVRLSVEQSLRRLRTDYLDVVLIHSNGEDERILRQDGALDTLQQLKQAGYIRAIGISSKTVAGGLLALELGCDVVMVTYNPSYTDELPILEAAANANKGILIKKALASGHLDKLGGKNPIEDTLAFIFAQAGVSSVVLGTLSPDHLRANIRAATAVLSL